MKILQFFKFHIVPILIGIVGLTAFSTYIIGEFSDFYFPEEGVAAEAINVFFSENFKFFALPHFKWHTDYFLYPFGIDSTFLFWQFGLNFVETLSYYIFGSTFPCQWYYVLSLAITYFGVYFLICQRRGCFWATFFAVSLTFCNYASICKFPAHFSHCIMHWMVLSLLTDAIIIEKVLKRESFSTLFLQSKVLLLLLCLGLEMGYIAGLCCLSFLMTAAYCALIYIARRAICDEGEIFVKDIMRKVLGSYKSNLYGNVVLSFLIFLVFYIYVPIVLQILVHTPSGMKEALWESHPLRILLPILPGFNAGMHLHGPLGVTDTVFAWNVGWFFLVLFVIAICWRPRENFLKWLPFVVLFALILAFPKFPILRLFPAFKCVRIAERFSPVIIVLVLIPLFFVCARPTLESLKRFVRTKSFLWPLIPLFFVETVVAYGTINYVIKDVLGYGLVKVPQDYRVAVDLVSKLPGEAIFFFPFTAHGGGGDGGFEIAGFHRKTCFQMQFAAKCGKKMNGAYVGRMFVKLYLSDFLNMKWPIDGQRPFSECQWMMLEKFFKSSNFSCFILETTHVSEALRDDVRRRFGGELTSFNVFNLHFEVYALTDGWRQENADLERIKSIPHEIFGRISYGRYSLPGEGNFLLRGFHSPEPGGVWTSDDESEIQFVLDKPETEDRIVVLKAWAVPSVHRVDVYCNNEKIDVLAVRPEESDYVLKIDKKFGRHICIKLVHHDLSRGCEAWPGSKDTRLLGFFIKEISIGLGRDGCEK